MKIFGEKNPLKGLDDYNLRAADAYLSGCEPTQIEPDSEHHSGDYNCNNCEDQECEYWADYNGVQIQPQEEKVFILNKPICLGPSECIPNIIEITLDEYRQSLQKELKQAKGKAKRSIRRKLRKLRVKNETV